MFGWKSALASNEFIFAVGSTGSQILTGFTDLVENLKPQEGNLCEEFTSQSADVRQVLEPTWPADEH